MPVDTPPARREEAVADAGEARSSECGLRAWSPSPSRLKTGQRAELRVREADRLEQPPHAGAIRAGEARRARLSISAALPGWHCLAARRRGSRCRGCAGSRPASTGPKTRAPMLSAACASAWKSTCAVRSTAPGASSGLAKACAADRLQGFAGRRFRRGRSRSRARRRAWRATRRPSSSAMLSARHSKISPISASRSSRRQHLLEQRDRIARVAELQLAALVELDHALVPAVDAHRRPAAPARRRRIRWRE